MSKRYKNSLKLTATLALAVAGTGADAGTGTDTGTDTGTGTGADAALESRPQWTRFKPGDPRHPSPHGFET